MQCMNCESEMEIITLDSWSRAFNCSNCKLYIERHTHDLMSGTSITHTDKIFSKLNGDLLMNVEYTVAYKLSQLNE